jgi:hypothetical protein
LLRSKCSFEVEVVSPVDALTLVVEAGFEPQRDAWSVRNLLDRNKESSVYFQAVRGDRIDLLGGVRSSPKALSSASRAHAPDRHCATSASRPFALNPQ